MEYFSYTKVSILLQKYFGDIEEKGLCGHAFAKSFNTCQRHIPVVMIIDVMKDIIVLACSNKRPDKMSKYLLALIQDISSLINFFIETDF